jgi:hypothetical protein
MAKEHHMRRTLIRIAPIVVLVLLSACGGSSPVSESIFFSGTVSYQGNEWHSLPLTSSGIVEINVRTLQPQLLEITDVIDLDLFIGLGIGQPANGLCTPTTRTTVREGDSVTYGLSVKEYCVSVFDTGALPEDATIRYTLELTAD